jgi:hypothetical protein
MDQNLKTDAETLTKTLCGSLAGAQFGDLTAAAVSETRRGVLDWIGCALAGSGHKTVTTLLSVLQETSGLARAYDVRGLRAFARDMRANWEEAERQVEGRPDAAQQSVALITIHAAKELEWPMVIPINTTGSPKKETGIIYDRRGARFSTPLFSVLPPAYTALFHENADSPGAKYTTLTPKAPCKLRVEISA